MTRNTFAITFAALIYFTALAQDGARGHWSGKLEDPNGGALNFEVDLDKTAKGWIGSITIPEQGVSGLALQAVTFENGTITFGLLKSGDNPPVVKGQLSDDGKSIVGNFMQAGRSLPITLKRTGEAKVAVPKVSPAVSKELTGKWEGTLEAGQSLRLALNIANNKDGSVATLTSIDQGNVEIPVSSVEQKDGKVLVKIPMINGGFEGKLNQEATSLTGEWIQNGTNFPLTFTKK